MSGSGDIASSLNLDLGPEHTQLDVDKPTAPLQQMPKQVSYMARAARIMKRAVDSEASKIPAYIAQEEEESKRTKPHLPEVKVPFCFP